MRDMEKARGTVGDRKEEARNAKTHNQVTI